MDVQQGSDGNVGGNGGPFQYSLRTMFIVTTALAIAFSVLFALPPVVRLIGAGLFLLGLPMALTVLLIYGRGRLRTFSVGALFPAVAAVWPFGSGVPMALAYGINSGGLDDIGYVPGVWVAVTFAVSVVFGLMAVGIRWMVEAPQRRQQREASVRAENSPASGPPASISAES